MIQGPRRHRAGGPRKEYKAEKLRSNSRGFPYEENTGKVLGERRMTAVAQ